MTARLDDVRYFKNQRYTIMRALQEKTRELGAHTATIEKGPFS